MNSPAVDIAVVAWPLSPARFKYCRLTIESMLALLTASRHQTRFVVSIGRERDPNRKWCGTDLEDYLNSVGIEYHYRTRPTERLGYAMNETIALCRNDYALIVQDDRPLWHPLDLSDGIDLMESESAIDIIRFGWPIGTKKAIATGPYKPGWFQVRLGGRFPYSDAPYMCRRSFIERFGKFDETTQHGASEVNMIQSCRKRKAVILVPGVRPYFGNICGEPAAFRESRRKARLQRIGKGQVQ